SMIEDEFLPRDLTLATPVAALRKVSYDLSLRQPLDLADGTSMTAVEMQWEYLDRAKKYAEEHGLECIGSPDAGVEVLRLWEQVLTGLEVDPSTVSAQVDWAAKHRLVSAYRERHDLRWDDARLAAMDLQYHDLRPDRCLAARVGLERLTSDAEVQRAVSEPPCDTRAYFRGTCLQRWAPQIVAANWDSMVFDVGGDPLRRVPMMDPTRGTEAHVGKLMAESSSVAELLDRLGQ
ncbi:MAG TPA: proteasome accessory factor PafA2 family protein, partial [Acidimicrobiales bacterium]|nr:proteasome accessory factor PafA2 family protein [Acidimicrobiales bacterium]